MSSYSVSFSERFTPETPIYGDLTAMSDPKDYQLNKVLMAKLDAGAASTVIALSGEHGMTTYADNIFPELYQSGLQIAAILSFASRSVNHPENSHFTIVAEELDIPICVVKTPLSFRFPFREIHKRRWDKSFPMLAMNNQAVSVELSKNMRKISVSLDEAGG